MWIMVSGPYRTGSTDPQVWAENLNKLNAGAYEILRKGHVPIIGVNMALPIIESAGQHTYDEVMLPLAIKLIERCDAVLRIGGPSNGADQEVQVFESRGLPAFRSLDEIPDNPVSK
jgi:hypothetical protein